MQWVYRFDEGSADMKDLLGGKGAGLAEMTRLGLSVPPGFTITTEACRWFLRTGDVPDNLWDEVAAAVADIEARTGRRFGATEGPMPLLVSVRSGAKFSMPGMMDTILDLGMNDAVAMHLAELANPRFAWDCHRRFVQTFGSVVYGAPDERFEAVLEALRSRRGVSSDAELTADDLEEATHRFRAIVEETTGRQIPDDPMAQLQEAVLAVFRSWNNRRAQEYRRIHGIPDDLGTAANVQMMVFGNLNERSGTGVCFTRDPATGERKPYGDYLPMAQGEDVVAGVRNTLTLEELAQIDPENYAKLLEIMDILERHFRDMCDIEFTIEDGVLWILQTRIGKRTAQAAVRMAVEMAQEGLIDEREAVLRVTPESLDRLLHPRLPDDVDAEPIAQGVPASPGAAVGAVVFDPDRAVKLAERGESVILVRWETTPEDIHGLAAASGVLTSHGGKTSHAAVVARGMGKPAVTGAEAIDVDREHGLFRVGDVVVREGDTITIDGTTGAVYLGALPLVEPEPTPELATLLAWADRFRRLGVRANADTPPDAARAREWGAEGIGLARTEHMFLGDRLPIVRTVILENDETARARALEELWHAQIEDFEGLLEVMDGLPVIIRLLDPPLHEFLPDRWSLEAERVEAMAAGKPTDDIERLMEQVARWEEANPMLGLRGVRLGIVMPDLYRAQVRAALEAHRRRSAAGGDPRLEIMVPLVAHAEELRRIRAMIEEEIAAAGVTDGVKIGTMIELPRAAITADQVAQVADFFSFGTNDLTQTTFGFSRDDAEGKFLPRYLEEGILEVNPFATLDRDGVGFLVRHGTERGKAANPHLEVGVCGEHGGDPDSIRFCHEVGLDYVSCSPFRIPIARLAAAHAALAEATADATA